MTRQTFFKNKDKYRIFLLRNVKDFRNFLWGEEVLSDDLLQLFGDGAVGVDDASIVGVDACLNAFYG